VPNFVEIAQTAAEIWPFFDFLRWRPSAILDFQKLKISASVPIRRANMRHRTKFREDRSNRSGDIADFRFFNMAAVRYLEWFYVCWDNPRRVLGGLCDCAKVGCNRSSNFDSMQILIFCTLSLKIPIHAPRIGFLGEFYPQNGEQHEQDPQKAHPRAEAHRMTYRSSKSVHVCGLGASRSIKQ